MKDIDILKAESTSGEDQTEELQEELQSKKVAAHMLNEQHEEEVILLSDSADQENLLNELQHTSGTDRSLSSLEVETDMNSEAQKDEQAITDPDNEVKCRAKSVDTRRSRHLRTRTHNILRILNRSSFFAIGLAILVAGGVASSYQPYVDLSEYENCTINQTT